MVSAHDASGEPDDAPPTAVADEPATVSPRTPPIPSPKTAGGWAGIGGIVSLAAFLWLPLPLARHANVNIPCHLLAERTALFVNLHTPVLVRLFAEQHLLRTIRALERNRNGAQCAVDLLGWVLLDRIPVDAIEEAERRR